LITPPIVRRKGDSGSSFLASNKKVLAFVGLQVLVIGVFIMWRKRKLDRVPGSSNRKDEV
jgi:F0F1-type ATP synthase membrane subunit a